MEIKCVDFDESHYATNIIQQDTIIKWDSLGSTHHMIIRGDYGANISFTQRDKQEIEKCGNNDILSGRESPCIANRYFIFLQKGAVNSYIFPVAPAKYAVYCCRYDRSADVCVVYLPNEACQCECDVSSRVDVNIRLETVEKGFFGRFGHKQSDKSYYIVKIPTIPGYMDGSLHYTYDGCKYRYPISRAMFGRDIYIPAYNDKPPVIKTKENGGYSITIHNL